MTLALTEQQRQLLDHTDAGPPRLTDPVTQTEYVLLRADVYERLKDLLREAEDQQVIRDLYPYVCEVFGREGWNDPEMAVYDTLA
jgi:hypothetical protein